MIICGYQGIGKSTLANTCMIEYEIPVLDLESGNFWVDGMRSQDWYKVYANIAIHLSQQGNIVMLSSHKAVRDYLYNLHSSERLATIYPSIDLRDQWIVKLENRYYVSKKEKDYKALMNAKEMYEQNVHDLKTQIGFDHIELKNIDYSLEPIITTYNTMVRMLPDGKKILHIDDCTIILKESCSDEQEV